MLQPHSCIYEGIYAHVFGNNYGETLCRIVVDAKAEKLVAAESFDGQKWSPLASPFMDDLRKGMVSLDPHELGLRLVTSPCHWLRHMVGGNA
jgi:hypothetical protein